jgi:hypothetical protein
VEIDAFDPGVQGHGLEAVKRLETVLNRSSPPRILYTFRTRNGKKGIVTVNVTFESNSF